MPGTIIQGTQGGSDSIVAVVDSKLRVIASPYGYALAEGVLPGHAEFEQFGYNPSVGTTYEDIWGGSSTYVFPTGATSVSVLGGANDTDTTGSGIQKVTITYLKTDFTEVSVDVNMAGATPVLVATDVFRVNRVIAKTVGATGVAHAEINVHLTGTAATKYSTIEAGNTRSRNSIYTVPKLKTLYVTSITASNGWVSVAQTPNNSVTFTLRAKYDHYSGTVRTFFLPHGEIVVGSGAGTATMHFDIPIKFIAGTDIKVSAFANTAGAIAYTAMRGWLE